MKKLFFLELTFLLLATTFSSNPPPPGWYQQTLPVSDFVNDIFFLDSLQGWVATREGNILHTINGGEDWNIQIDSAGDFQSIQFPESSTGYALANGLHGLIYKTTNGGTNWEVLHDFNPTALFKDMSFINKDTGWICSEDIFDGGVFKTTNGGISWDQQLNYNSENPQTIFFANKDTGWTGNQYRKLFKTTNGGLNWNLQIIFPSFQAAIEDILFFNSNTGFVSAARIYKTTNGGTSWDTANDDGIKLSFANDSIGWCGSNFFNIKKTTDGGLNWVIQNSPIFNNTSVSAVSNLIAWAGASGIVHTSDGGGLTVINNVNINSALDFTLYQNYPNPFNPNTIISYVLPVGGVVKLRVFDISGKEIETLVNKQQNSGNYEIKFDASRLPSGVYFYNVKFMDNKSNQTVSKTKKMLLLK